MRYCHHVYITIIDYIAQQNYYIVTEIILMNIGLYHIYHMHKIN